MRGGIAAVKLAMTPLSRESGVPGSQDAAGDAHLGVSAGVTSSFRHGVSSGPVDGNERSATFRPCQQGRGITTCTRFNESQLNSGLTIGAGQRRPGRASSGLHTRPVSLHS